VLTWRMNKGKETKEATTLLTLLVGSEAVQWFLQHRDMKMLEPSRMDTHAKYPYLESHVIRALSLLLAQQHTQ
jgi:hypothetical protein